MDNRQFNINGKTKQQLSLAVRSLLLDEYGTENTVKGYYFDEKCGLVLTWYVGEKYKAIPFTNRMGVNSEVNGMELVEILWSWLKTDDAKKVVCEGWDKDEDHDGSNDLGWRLYIDEWGHVKVNEDNIDHYSIAAFKPAYLWYGK